MSTIGHERTNFLKRSQASGFGVGPLITVLVWNATAADHDIKVVTSHTGVLLHTWFDPT